MNRKRGWIVALLPALYATTAVAQDPFKTGVPDNAKARRLVVDTQALGPAARPGPAVLQRTERRDAVPGSCEYSQAILCYNYAAGSSVYKPSRKLMPDLPGLQRESVALRRDRITFRYSFK